MQEPKMIKLLKIQVGDVYVQVPVDEGSNESIQLVLDTLKFFAEKFLKEAEKETV